MFMIHGFYVLVERDQKENEEFGAMNNSFIHSIEISILSLALPYVLPPFILSLGTSVIRPSDVISTH